MPSQYQHYSGDSLLKPGIAIQVRCADDFVQYCRMANSLGVFDVEFAPMPWPFIVSIDDKEKGMITDALHKNKIKPALHIWLMDVNYATDNPIIREASENIIMRCIEFAADIGARHIVLHPPFFYDARRLRSVDEIANLFSKFASESRKKGVLFCTENMPPIKHRAIPRDITELAHILKKADKNLGLLLDVGHANLEGMVNGYDGIPEYILKFKEKIFAMHLHDNNGKIENGIGIDEHLQIGMGRIDWKAFSDLTKGINAVAYLETRPPSSDVFGASIKKLREYGLFI